MGERTALDSDFTVIKFVQASLQAIAGVGEIGIGHPEGFVWVLSVYDGSDTCRQAINKLADILSEVFYFEANLAVVQFAEIVVQDFHTVACLWAWQWPAR